MKQEGTESPMEALSLSNSNRFESSSLSRLQLGDQLRSVKSTAKNHSSVILQQRQQFRVIEDDVDVTPKLLEHPLFSTIDDKQMTAFETIGLSQTGSIGQLSIASGTGIIKKSSSVVVKTPSMATGSITTEDGLFQSLLSTQTEEVMIFDEDRAPPIFYLPSVDPNVLYSRPETVTITLKETETFFFFEMQPRVGDLQTPEGVAIQWENELYESKTSGSGAMRKLIDSETQTVHVLRRSRGTYLSEVTRKNQGTLVNNWVMHDTYAVFDSTAEDSEVHITHRKKSIDGTLQTEHTRSRFQKSDTYQSGDIHQREQMHIFKRDDFRNAVRVMEHIISNNIFIHALKRFTGLIKQDPCSLDLEFTYSLDLLWTHTSDATSDRPVSAFSWNYVNRLILAVGYGARANSEVKDGLVLIWSAKNPGAPDRCYAFNSQVSGLDWSRDRPNLLAIGFYNGQIKVIDVSSQEINIVRGSQKTGSSSTSPQWQVQWWPGDEQYEYQEQIYTCNQDGCVFRYRYVEDFTSTVIMRVYRIEGTLPGVTKSVACNFDDMSVNRSPGVLILRKHPTSNTLYFIGSDEGCIYKCSTDYLYQHIDSFLAHDGAVYSMMFSPFCSKIFLTCGADWCLRIWAEGLTEPLITLSTTMACVQYAAWCPVHSTILASIVNNEICIWDIRRKIHKPSSVTTSPSTARFVMADFTANGKQLVAADVEGAVYVYNLEGMPFPPYNQEQVLVESIEKALLTKPMLLKHLKKLGAPFSP